MTEKRRLLVYWGGQEAPEYIYELSVTGEDGTTTRLESSNDEDYLIEKADKLYSMGYSSWVEQVEG